MFVFSMSTSLFFANGMYDHVIHDIIMFVALSGAYLFRFISGSRFSCCLILLVLQHLIDTYSRK